MDQAGPIRRIVVRRTACVDLAAFPLQLLLREHTDWRGLPTVVVDHDTPQGVILWANDHRRYVVIGDGTGSALAGRNSALAILRPPLGVVVPVTLGHVIRAGLQGHLRSCLRAGE